MRKSMFKECGIVKYKTKQWASWAPWAKLKQYKYNRKIDSFIILCIKPVSNS